MNQQTQRNVLIVVVLLLCASIFLQFRHEPPSTTLVTRAPARDSGLKKDNEVLHTGLLSQETPRFFTEKRNIFEFHGSQPISGPIEAPVVLLKTPPKPEKPPMPDVHYLGFYVEKENPAVKLAAISNSGNIYVGKVGDVLGGKYRVLQIEKMFLLLRLVSDDRVIRLPLGRQTGVFIGEDSTADDQPAEDDEEDGDEDE